MAYALVILVAGSVLFHLASPWWTTPLASNWGRMDDMLSLTLVITGVAFVVLNLFLAYTLWRFRHREGHRAAYAPDDRKLERRLIVGTTLGIAALLAPGLIVYADYVRPPSGAVVMEVLGQQWRWSYRFPGADGRFGGVDPRFVAERNLLGLDPADAAGADDLIVPGSEVRLPLNRPVQVLLRSNDVLHDFYVPQFRARMNIVPGTVTSFWFTPTRTGRFEALCSQLCGVAHYNMRGIVEVVDELAWQAWLAGQTSFADASRALPAGSADTLAARGAALAQSRGCIACHSVDGSARIGPTWRRLWGKTERFDDGSSLRIDEATLETEIRDPASRTVAGFPRGVMPRAEVGDDELAAFTAYIKSLEKAP